MERLETSTTEKKKIRQEKLKFTDLADSMKQDR